MPRMVDLANPTADVLGQPEYHGAFQGVVCTHAFLPATAAASAVQTRHVA